MLGTRCSLIVKSLLMKNLISKDVVVNEKVKLHILLLIHPDWNLQYKFWGFFYRKVPRRRIGPKSIMDCTSECSLWAVPVDSIRSTSSPFSSFVFRKPLDWSEIYTFKINVPLASYSNNLSLSSIPQLEALMNGSDRPPIDEKRIIEILGDLLLANEIFVIHGEPIDVNLFMFLLFMSCRSYYNENFFPILI